MSLLTLRKTLLYKFMVKQIGVETGGDEKTKDYWQLFDAMGRLQGLYDGNKNNRPDWATRAEGVLTDMRETFGDMERKGAPKLYPDHAYVEKLLQRGREISEELK